ncbi:type VII secretion protein EsaA [Enterococcus faecium]|uniref:type VII secretion protein EsaA n=1 Tax=Enterococcus faecium TaxID=1352 RepID=UPI0023B236C3|nr:type VII secretion protein EsaA [Enterococcus faecium]
MLTDFRRNISLFLTIAASLFLLLFFLYLGFKDENVTISTTDPTGKMQYALVNEDKGAVFEGKNYSLGSDFVTLINKDSKNRWETTTRNIATAGVESGQFDAQIIIPQDFSEKLLSLQSINPEKALIEYQVRDGQNEITNQMVQDNINMILTDFNQRIIQMYFSSIVGNLFEAQQNVNQIAGTQVNYQTNLESSIYSPFKEIPGNYTNVLETASILDTDNQSFTAQQQAFVQSVKELLDRNNQGLEGGCQSTETVKESVEDYTKQANEKLKESIKQFNDQVAMQKKQLNEQWETDTADYKKQHDQLNETILSQLGDFYTNNEQESTGVYAGFLSESVLFQVTQIKRITELQAEIAELQAQTEQLTQLKSQIAATYYNDPAATPDTATTEQVKTAILQLISDLGGNTPKLNAEYQGTLETSLAQIPDKSLEQLVDELAKQQVITPDQASLYLDELAIVRKYAHDLNKPLGKEIHFTYLDPRQGHPEMITIPQQTVTLSMDPTKENTYSIQLPADSQEQVSVMLDGPKLQEIEQLVNDELHPYRYQTTIIDHSDHQFTFAAPEKIEETEESTQDSTDDLQEKELPKQVTFTVNLPIIWHLNSIEQATSYNELHYSWCRNETVQSDHHYAVYLPVDQPLIDDVPKILTHLQALDTVAQQIATLFGNPNQSLSVQSYAAMIRASENQGKTVLELAKDQSIYRRYDNIKNAEKQTVITDKLYEEYKKSGDRIYKDTETQIKGMVGRDLVHRYPEHTPDIGEKYIEIQNWKVYHPIYPNKAIIKNVDFYIRSGEIVGIAGLMGAGRTEFARSIFGKSYGTNISGTIKKAGKEIYVSSVKDAIAHGLAYATEDRKENGLVLVNDIKQNISLASLSRIAKASMIDEAMEIQQAEWMSEKLRIKSSSISQLTEHLSGGNQQKVVLAKWMLTEPDVLFFDEPTRGIDVGAKFEIYKIIQQIAKTGKAICLISSELPELLGMCDRIYTMNEGEFTGEFLKKDANQERLMTYMTSKEGANEK